MSRRPHNIPIPTSSTTPYSLALLSEYTHTLDSLPLDLSRNFADLRELDAVLSSSMSALTAKITQLTAAIESNTASKEDRLWQLAEIAEEASRLKLGSEDKIRVACHAADGLRGHRTHMKVLLDKIPDPDFTAIDLLQRKTVYPHIATRAFLPVGMTGEGGRRQRRGAYGSLLANSNAVEASPSKRKRVAGREDDADVSKTPRKDRTGENAPAPQRQRNGARAKKTDRATSPTESLVSVASHLPQANHLAHPRQTVNGRSGSAVANKRSRTGQTNGDHLAVLADPSSSRKDIYHAPPSSSTAHPSLPLPFGHGGANGMHPHELNGAHVIPNVDWPHGQLEGPGMPVARNFVGAMIIDNAAEAATNTGGEGDGEGDDGRTYCFCDGVSYGEMIACDDANCEREWFHITCIGLSVPPEGRWYCETCRARRNSRRSGRGGKKRAGGGARAGARNTST